MDITSAEVLKQVIGGLTSGLTVGAFLSIQSRKQKNSFRNSGTINIHGDNAKINSDNNTQINSDNNNVTHVTSFPQTVSPSKTTAPATIYRVNANDADASALLVILVAAMVGAIYGLVWHIEKVELAVYAIATLTGVAGMVTAVARWRKGKADEFVAFASVLFAAVGFWLAPEAMAAMKVTISPELKARVAEGGAVKFIFQNAEYAQYIIFQFFGLVTTTFALAWQVLFAYKQRTLGDNPLGYALPVIVGGFSYLALSGNLYHLFNS